MKTTTRWQQEATQWLAQHYRMRVRGEKQQQHLADPGGHRNSMWRRLDRHLRETIEHASWNDRTLRDYIKRHGQRERHAGTVRNTPVRKTATTAK